MAFARAIGVLGLSLAMTYLGVYLVETRGYPAWLYGVICLAANLGQSWAAAWAGNLSDRIGRRPVITTSLFVRAVVIAALGTQITLDAPLWSLAITIVISAMLRGCFEPVAYALVADIAPDDQRIAAFGLQRMGTNLGWAVGPALGGVLTLWLPYGTIFYLAAAGMIAAGIVCRGVVDPARRRAAETTDVRGALREGLADPMLRLILAGTLLCALLETQMFSTLAIYMTDRLHFTKASVGLLYTINGVGVLLLQIPALALINRLGITTVLPWASLLDALGFALIGVGSGFAGLAIAMVALTGAEIMFDPAHQTAIAEIADPAHRGRTFGVVGFVQTLGIAIAPVIGGALLDVLGDHHAAMWALIACFGLGQAACFTAYVRRRGPGQPVPAAIRAAPSAAKV